jgi:hypothetical protein
LEQHAVTEAWTAELIDDCRLMSVDFRSERSGGIVNTLADDQSQHFSNHKSSIDIHQLPRLN